MVNWSDVQNRLTEGMARHGDRTDFLAIRLETSQSTQIVLESQRVDTLSEAISLGGQVRAYYRGGWGFASFNQLDQLEAQIEQAIAAAKQVGGFAQAGLAPIAPIQDTVILPLPQGDPREISLREKKYLCDRYADLLHQADPHIVSTTVRYSDSTQHTLLATSEGTLIDQTWTDLEMRFAATARQGDCVQTGRETSGSRQGYQDLLALDGAVIAAGKRAAQALNLPPVQGDRYTVVIDPILTGLFVHEAFGHLSEADMAYENPDLLAVMEFGKRFGPEALHIFDGAAPPGHRGSYCYDDEGTPATTTPLIESGRLVGRLHSRETAGHLGETPTGNARCLNYHYPPLVRMTNTWIERGHTPVASLCDGITLGVYAANWLGGMTNGEMFTFTAGEAWMIRNGQRAEPVRDVTLSGNVFKTLATIEAIGDDFGWDESGGCGKGGQNGLAVGCGGPSLRIRDVVVGGDCAD